MTTTTATLADQLGVSEDDVKWTIREYLGIDLPEDDVPKNLITELHDVLNPHCARTVPERYGLAELSWRLDVGPLWMI